MANAGKKRAATSTSSGSAGKKLKIANKQASSKHKGKAPSSSKSRVQQKSVDEYSTFSKPEESRSGSKKGVRETDDGLAAAPKLLRDKKGKATIKEFVELPVHMQKLKNKKQRKDGDDEDESSASDDDEDIEDLGIEDMLAAADSDDDDQDPSSSKQDFAKRAQFLSKLDMNELARSRAHLLNEHRASKPETSTSARHKQLPKIARATAAVNSDDEENIDDLEEDDFANLKDSDDDGGDDSLDDELSVMSDADGDDLADLSTGDEDDSDLGDSDLDDEDLSEDEGDWTGSSHTLSDNENLEDLEDRYATLHKKKSKREEEEAKKRHTKLPVFGAQDDEDEDDEDDLEASEDDSEAEEATQAISKRKSRVAHAPVDVSDESEDDEQTKQAKARAAVPKSNPLGARFGRPAVSSLLEIEDRMERFHAAREELAVLGREIMAEPELGMNLLKRLVSFTMPVFYPNVGDKKDEGIPIDYSIRSLAMLSLLAVFLDIIPGYRIRAVTDKEKAMRATQAVLQQREFEEGLVSCYRRYLETCEVEIKGADESTYYSSGSMTDFQDDFVHISAKHTKSTANSPAAPVALKCMCELLKEKSQFNFATNILEVLVKTLGRRNFSSSSELCVSTLASILGSDTTGNMSLHTVRLLARTVKARGYSIHPAALTCLLYLRFPDHGIRASQDSVDRPAREKRFPGFNKKGKIVPGQYINKKARKAMKEKWEIEKEMAEAENEMNTEDITRNSTETLKLLFALYFRILKMPISKNDKGESPKETDKKKIEELLPAALEGLTRFSHLVNVDFFRDLLNVLKQVAAECQSSRTQLLCIGTALDLLSGQGEALNIDLSDLIARLYALIPPLTVDVTIEEKPSSFYPATLRKTLKALSATSYSNQTSADVMFRILAGLFLKTRMPNPQARVLAFSKRLLTACLHWPKVTALRCLGFLRALLLKERCLESMLRSEDRRRDGVYRYDTDQEGLANTEATAWYELALLEQRHYDEEVRAEANRLSRWSKDE